MKTLSFQKARKQLAATMNQVCKNHEPIVIRRKDKRSVVLISKQDFDSLEETSYLLKSRTNAMRLLQAVESLEKRI